MTQPYAMNAAMEMFAPEHICSVMKRYLKRYFTKRYSSMPAGGNAPTRFKARAA